MRSLSCTVESLRKDPRFTWPVVLAPGVGVGAATCIFSVFSAMLLRPMGIREPASCVALWASDPSHGQDRVEIRTHGDPVLLADSARRVVLSADPSQLISNVTTMAALVDRALARSRFHSFMLSGLSCCALLLAAGWLLLGECASC